MKNFFATARVLIGAALPLFCTEPASAFGDKAPGMFVEGGHALYDGARTDAWAVGAVFPWSWNALGATNGRSFAWELFASHWRAPSLEAGRRDYVQLGAVATLRYRFDSGNSPWFAEAGIGATVMNSLYRTPDRQFSTAFQFTEVLGLGRTFGTHGEHELSVRLQHFSNASIKEPNPGANFARLRYLYRF